MSIEQGKACHKQSQPCVGAVLGMTAVGAGAGCVRWGYPGLLAIVASWFASPILAGLMSAVMLVCIKKAVLEVTILF